MGLGESSFHPSFPPFHNESRNLLKHGHKHSKKNLHVASKSKVTQCSIRHIVHKKDAYILFTPKIIIKKKSVSKTRKPNPK